MIGELDPTHRGIPGNFLKTHPRKRCATVGDVKRHEVACQALYYKCVSDMLNDALMIITSYHDALAVYICMHEQ